MAATPALAVHQEQWGVPWRRARLRRAVTGVDGRQGWGPARVSGSRGGRLDSLTTGQRAPLSLEGTKHRRRRRPPPLQEQSPVLCSGLRWGRAVPRAGTRLSPWPDAHWWWLRGFTFLPPQASATSRSLRHGVCPESVPQLDFSLAPSGGPGHWLCGGPGRGPGCDRQGRCVRRAGRLPSTWGPGLRVQCLL